MFAVCALHVALHMLEYRQPIRHCQMIRGKKSENRVLYGFRTKHIGYGPTRGKPRVFSLQEPHTVLFHQFSPCRVWAGLKQPFGFGSVLEASGTFKVRCPTKVSAIGIGDVPSFAVDVRHDHSPHTLHTRLFSQHFHGGETVSLIGQSDSIFALTPRAPCFNGLPATVPVDGFKTLFAILTENWKIVHGSSSPYRRTRCADSKPNRCCWLAQYPCCIRG
jgi:hypothetical protein